jgi:PAS domain S-box-containing protein
MKIRTQLFAGLFVIGILSVIIFALMITTNQQVEQLVDQANIADDITLGIGELGYLSNDYILYGEPQQIERWQTKYASVSELIAGLAVDQPEQQAIVSDLISSLRNTKAVFDDIASNTVQNGGTSDTRFIQLSWSRIAVQQQGMVFDAGRLSNLLRIQAEDLRQTRILLIFALAGVFVTLLFTTYGLYYRRTLGAIASLQEGARIVGSGNLEYIIEEKGDDEISELCRSFNRMSSDLKKVTASKGDLEKEIANRKRVEIALQQRTEDLVISQEELRVQNKELNAAQDKLQAIIADLARSESLLRSLFDSPGMMRGIVEVVADDDIRHLSDNTVTAGFIGLTTEAMKNKLGSELGEPPEILRLWVNHYRESEQNGKPVHFEYHYVHGNQEAWLYTTVNFLGKNENGESRFSYVIQDITDRKRAEEELNRKQTEIEVLFTNIPAGLVLFDATRPYTVLVHNRYYQELFAEPFRSQGMTGLNVYQYAPEVEAAGVVAVFDEVVRTRQPKSILDFPYNSNPFKETWCNWYMAPIIIDEKVVALVSMSLDVTDRHRAEEALRETSQYLENLITYANAPIIVWDPMFSITRFNHAFERLTGREAEDVIGKQVDILFPEKYRTQSMGLIQKTSTGEKWEIIEIPILHRDGTIKTVLWNSATLYEADGKTVLSTIAQGQDITERKKAEEEILRLASFPERNPNPITELDREGSVLYCNPAASLLFPDLENQGSVHPFLSNASSILEEFLKEGSAYHIQDVQVDSHIYQQIWHYLPDSKRIRIYSTDITARKIAEETLQGYADQLKRSNEDLERFAYIASHDLQEPLRNVVSFAQLLSRRYQGKLNPDADEYIGYIVEGGKRMQMLVSDLLDYSRVNTRGQAFQPVNTSDLVDHVVQNLYSQVQESNAVIVTDPLPVIEADSVQLGMVFQNLISNAIKFRRNGVAPRIHISADRVNNTWKFSIKDNGIGIDPAFYDRIFVIFQRLHPMDKYPGTGVGLAIVKKIIERHGGTIWVESEVGKGTTFHFTLPAGT